MAAELGQFLEEAASIGHLWGENDCLMFPANWILHSSGRDPAAPWRGTYVDQDGAARILAKAGGPVLLMAAGCDQVGAAQVSPEHAGPGAVGIVLAEAAEGLQQTGAIRTNVGWAVLDAQGLAVGPFPALAAWAVI